MLFFGDETGTPLIGESAVTVSRMEPIIRTLGMTYLGENGEAKQSPAS